MKVKDLPKKPTPDIMLYCDICGSESSALAGDYFQLPGDYVFKCCGYPMWLVRKEVKHISIEDVCDAAGCHRKGDYSHLIGKRLMDFT